MDKQFNYIVRQLESDDNLIIEVLEFFTENPIVKTNERLNARKMIAQSGSVEEWFIDHVKQKGFKKVQVQLFREQGSAKVRQGRAYNFVFSDEETETVNHTVEPSNTSTASPVPAIGLNGAIPGLGIPDMINLNVDRAMLQIAKEDLANEKAKTSRLEQEKKDLEDKVRSMEKSSDSKAFIAQMVKDTAPAIQGLLGMIQAKPSGLNAPQPAMQFPEGPKGTLLRIIMDAEGISESQVNAIYYTLEAFSENKVGFAKELEQLFIKHKITSDGNHSQSHGG